MSAPMQSWTPERVRALMDEERAWPRYELIDGELLVTPAPQLVHQAVVGELYRTIANYVDLAAARVTVFLSPADLELVPGSIVQPDVFVVPAGPTDPLPGWPVIHSLVLAAEVLSASTARYDRITKRRFFTERADVAEYWIVDPDARVVERWMHGDDRPSVHEERLDWQPAGADRTLTIDLPRLFRRAWRD